MRGDTDDQMVARLEALLAAHGVVRRVERLDRLSGGASRETWSFDLSGSGEPQRMILQRQRAGTISGGPGMEGEAALLVAAADLGVPVPTVVATDGGRGAFGAPCIVTTHLTGETIARKLLRDDEWATARTRLVTQAGAALAAIHKIDPAVAPALRQGDQLDEMRTLLDGFAQPLPAFELALRWLNANRPTRAQSALVHGDFRLGNLMVDAEGLIGVLDWELAHVGDAVEDLGWFCVRAWRFGSPLPAGGMGSREELLSAYEQAGGDRVEPAALRWWEVLGTVKWGLICVLQAQVHLSGASRSVELAAIGRRVCENEWDVLSLIPGPPLPAAQLVPPAPSRDLHVGPSAAELVMAVREWVESDVRAATSGRVAFHTLVAAKALAIVERELLLGVGQEAMHLERLAALGCDNDAALAASIRSGALDDRNDEVRAAVAASVRARLEVANPRWLDADD